ncbi:MAG: DUF2892 domain-containing protein [Aurantimonas endophytica]|jgi:hypothetical protein|uniref:Inner membrane protein YgaP-like transmembrane domain-containing protein n=1 Tax=Aurantimonas endophytica TaxID=1522175 RepID=A0A7W6MNT3_9HYPH|nr:DUF2892 domain-containing protein [Aurantimonas endophytica]MBB4002209.1 hypothetical protein [Aurantimonas endophytica]MCO6402162.1 DUF2892 domain-containing protein [Aurantimonas endophytica]
MALFRTANVGTEDRVVRIVLAAIAAIAAYAYLAAPWSYVAYAVALILLLTAVVRFCPAYALFGASTCRRPTAH